MTLLIERAELSGRLKLVHDEPGARDFIGQQIGQVRLIAIPGEQDLDAELDFLTNHLPSHVASLGGEYPDGSPWILLVERAPSASLSAAGEYSPAAGQLALAQLFERVVEGNPAIGQTRTWVIDPTELRSYYAWACDDPAAPGSLSFCDQLRGLVAEACGYSLASAVALAGQECAFPGIEHDCQSELFADVFQGWLDGIL